MKQKLAFNGFLMKINKQYRELLETLPQEAKVRLQGCLSNLKLKFFDKNIFL